MPSRLLSAFLVLALPMATVLLVRNVPLIVLPKALTIDMRVGCFVRDPADIERARIDRACEDARPVPEAKEPAKGTQQAGSPAGAGPRATRPETPAQFRATEARTRVAFGMASAVLQAVAFGALIFAFSQLVQNWGRRAPAGDANKPADFEKWRLIIALTSLGVLGFAAWIAWADARSHDFDNVLIGLILAAGETTGTLRAGTAASYGLLMTANLIAAYLAAGLLLVYLATLALPFGAPTTMSERFTGFQFVIAIGATVLAMTVYTNQKAVDLALLAIDPSAGASLIETVRAVLDLWSTICIVFLFTAIVTGYFGIRASGTTASAAQPDSALAMRTPGGDDLKTLGWIVQLIFALAPAWLPAALKTIFEQVGKAPF